MKTNPALAFLFLVLALIACNLPSQQAPQDDQFLVLTVAAQTVQAASANQPQPTSQPPSIATANPTATNTLPPPAVPATNTSLPCNMASFVADVTYPDNTSVQINTAFTKTWRLKNVGSCTWTSGYQIVFDSGDQMSGPGSQQLTTGTVPPGQSVDVSVNLVAPASAGTYKGNWRLREPGGVLFALSTGPFWVQIKAKAAGGGGGGGGWPTYAKGDSGDEVFAIQYLLKAQGFNVGVDGIFGPQTQSKVEDFQTTQGLSEDAFVGPETWSALIIQVSQGSSGDAVRAVQKLLKSKYGYGLNVDGIFGPQTASAVKDFQDNHGLSVDGIVGPKTWQALISG